MKLKALISDLLKKSGIPTDSPKLDEVMALDIDIDDEIGNGINSKLMTLEAAESNTVLKNKLWAEALNTADKRLEAMMSTLGFTAEQITEVKAASSGTYGRIDAVGAIAKKNLDAKAAGGGSGAKEADLIKEVNKLNETLSTLKDQHAAALALKDAEVEKKLVDLDLDASFEADDFGALPETMPIDTKKKFVKDLVLGQAQAKGLVVKKGDDGKLQLLKADGSKYFDEATNKEVGLTDFKLGVLTQNQTRKVSDVKTTGKQTLTLEGGASDKVLADTSAAADMLKQAETANP